MPGESRIAPRKQAAALALAAAAFAACGAALGGEEEAQGGWFRGVRMELAPLRWSGSIGSELRRQRSSGQEATLTRLDLANVNAATYLWQPWFAQLRGGLGVLRSSHAGGADTPHSRSDSLTGEAALSVFPLSRFPFDAHASVTDSRASGEFTTNDFRTTRYGVRQGYRTPDETTSYSARLERSTLTSAAFAPDTLDVMEAAMSRRIGAHQVELNGGLSHNRGGAGGSETRLARGSARHAFNPGSNLSVESLGSVHDTEARAAQSGAFGSRFMQVTSFATWRPEQGEPLYNAARPAVFTASARLYSLAAEAGEASSESTTANASLGASYTLDARTRLNANANVTHTAAAAGDTLFTAQSLAMIYTPEPRPLGAFVYSWNATGSFVNSTASGEGARQLYLAQASHGLTRAIPAGEAAQLSLVLGQGAGVSLDAAGDSATLTHNAAANWSAGNGGGQTYVGLSAADSRVSGASSGAFQLVNLQASRQQPLSGVSYWTGNLTVQGTRQQPGPEKFDWTTSGSLSYLHQRAFGVARLRFTGTYTANLQQLASRSEGDLEAPREFTSRAAEGRFDYAIGKLELRLSARSAVVAGTRNSLVFLRAVRHF